MKDIETKQKEQLALYAHKINEALDKLVPMTPGLSYSVVLEAMRYSLLDAGKRIRGALTLEFGRLCGAPEEGALALACSMEMVHAYSLIHDDLPCMDNDDYRRGKPSCHKKFGEANALLAGDALLTLAFETAASAPLDDKRRGLAVRCLSKAAGTHGMVGGQVIDLESEGKPLTLEMLGTLCALKTGALLRAAAQMGCIAGNADPAVFAAADRYAAAFGLAFQITDDILDVTGETDKLGKPVGSDAHNEKTTYATLLGVDAARKSAVDFLNTAKEAAAELGETGFLIWLADMVLNRDH